MTTEIVLLLGLYAFILLGVFLGPSGPIETFRSSVPRLGARIERNVAIGYRHRRADRPGESHLQWKEPVERR